MPQFRYRLKFVVLQQKLNYLRQRSYLDARLAAVASAQKEVQDAEQILAATRRRIDDVVEQDRGGDPAVTESRLRNLEQLHDSQNERLQELKLDLKEFRILLKQQIAQHEAARQEYHQWQDRAKAARRVWWRQLQAARERRDSSDAMSAKTASTALARTEMDDDFLKSKG